jgi:branched-subunit amino acid transport protein AzlD
MEAIYEIDPALLRLDLRLSDFVGLCGTVIDLSVFLLLRTGRMDGRGYGYPLVTAAASVLVLISLGARFNLAASLSELAWLALVTWCLVRTGFPRRTHPPLGHGD